ncbi:MAG: N-acyl-D-amino-acid deacylase family protein [Planctomycetales bacterium]|jgi:N-acyl-D-amino-acid deacylase
MNNMLRSLAGLTGFVACAVVFTTLQTGQSFAADPVDADLLLVNGTIHIGDGKPAQIGDVAIVDDQIVAVGKFEIGTTKQRIDCTGLVVSPGFIDLHNHSDTPATRKETRACVNYLTQGCTTLVTGNCGSGPVDVAAYYDKLDEYGIGLNIAHLLPQGSLRREVMQSERRDATADELARMKTLAAAAMKDGAWGMSSGLLYVPSSYADTKELTDIAKVVSEHGGIYASHIRGEGSGLLDAVNEALQIGRGADLPVHVSHFKSSGKDSWGLVRVAIDIIRKERAAGRIVTADQYPYIASSTSLAATFIPSWGRAGGTKDMLERLEPGPDYDRIHAAISKKLESTDQGQRIQIARYRPNPTWAGQRLKEIADQKQIAPLDLVLQILKSDSGTKVVNFSINEDDVRYVMQQPWVATASDGSAKIPSEDVPHPRNYGTFPRKIGRYSIREGVVPLTQAIRSSTGLPADILGLHDRGYLRVGMKADIAVLSEKDLIDKATFAEPHQYCEGIRYLLVNGTPAIWNGSLTGALAGRALRHDPTSSRNVASPK